jgi:hypothetical protein
MNETVTLFSSPDTQQDNVLASNLHNRKRFKVRAVIFKTGLNLVYHRMLFHNSFVMPDTP